MIKPAQPKAKRPYKNENHIPAEKPIPKRKRTVSEEGEISAKSSSSSSSEDDSDEDVPAKSRRAVRRSQKRQNIKNNHYDMKLRLHEMYNQRFDLVSFLSVRQKAELLDSLQMIGGEYDEVMKSKADLARFLAQP